MLKLVRPQARALREGLVMVPRGNTPLQFLGSHAQQAWLPNLYQLDLGPDMQGLGFDDKEMMKLRAQRGGRAGGWNVELSKRRGT
ncbi:hypothetical protein F0562_009257 [Nyssa sinensis]|uniref:Uncharacterized protein n=1 Tax=Nyssa sinensis TaxID=561372 RepID=A0A5J4ZY47_9ASTE|nr:hypothetical protein F0562_009257 [Nyssa sinensis]